MAAQRSLCQILSQLSARILPKGWLLSQLWQGITPPSGATAMLLRQAPQLGTRVRPRARSVSSFSQPGLVKSSSISSSSVTATAFVSTSVSCCSVSAVARLSSPTAPPEGISPEQVT